jgi:hypothetical protein
MFESIIDAPTSDALPKAEKLSPEVVGEMIDELAEEFELLKVADYREQFEDALKKAGIDNTNLNLETLRRFHIGWSPK